MNNRRKALYEFLLGQTDWVRQSDIAVKLYDHYGNIESCLDQAYHDTTERRRLSDDISFINASPDFEKIIISNQNGVKIASEEEFADYISHQYNAAVRKLARVYKMAKKGNRHGQIDFGGHTFESFFENLPDTP